MGTGNPSAPHARPRTAKADGGEEQGHGHRGEGDRGRPEPRRRALRGRERGTARTRTYLRRNSPVASGKRPGRAAGASPPAKETQRRGRVSGRRAGVLGVGRGGLLTSESELLLWFSDSLTRDDLTSSRSRCADALSLLGSCSSPPSSWKGISSSLAPRSSPPPAAPAPEPPLPPPEPPPPPPPPPPSWGMVGPRAGAAALRAPRRPRPARPGARPSLPPSLPFAGLLRSPPRRPQQQSFDRAWPGGKRGRRDRTGAGAARLGPLGQRGARGSLTRCCRCRLLRRGVPAPGPPGRGERGRKEGPARGAGGPEGGAPAAS